jgi:hypothetical protein
MDCPIHGPHAEDADPFDETVSAMIAMYLMSREIAPDYADGRSIVSVHAHLDDDPDVFTLRIGLGMAAHDLLNAERIAHGAVIGQEAQPMRLSDVFGPGLDLDADTARWDSDGGR